VTLQAPPGGERRLGSETLPHFPASGPRRALRAPACPDTVIPLRSDNAAAGTGATLWRQTGDLHHRPDHASRPNNASCVDVCPVDCIYEADARYFIHPDECIDYGACEPECPVQAIFSDTDVPPEWTDYIELNSAHLG
jgi:ferredoxin